MEQIEHDEAAQRFVIRFPEGFGELVYRRLGPHLVDLTHTEVSPRLRGQGIAGRLVEAGLVHFRQAGDRIIPSCPYVHQWMAKRPGESDLLFTPLS